MKAVDSKNGFTVVELMIAALATTILALSVGSMLYFGWLGWLRNNESVNMQRDASLAMRVIAREIHSAVNITYGASWIECVNPSNTIRFTKSGGDLDMAEDGNFQMHLIRDVVGTFTPAPGSAYGSVDLTLQLAAGDDTATITETVYTRN